MKLFTTDKIRALDQYTIQHMQTYYYYLSQQAIKLMLKKRSRFSHKGTYGHLALFAGSKGMAGAAVLAAKAAVRTGLGLLTVYSPACNREILQTAVPEAMFKSIEGLTEEKEAEKPRNFNALAIGPGLGTTNHSFKLLQELINSNKLPMVLDADALNIIAANKDLLQLLSPGTIITPHPKEFERLIGKSVINALDAVEAAKELASRYQLIIVLKGAYTKIITAEGKVYFNSTGNTGMATGGSGDVLTGMIGALLAQGYESKEAAKLGVYLHGLAADIALQHESEESLIAGDIIANIGKAFKQIREDL